MRLGLALRAGRADRLPAEPCQGLGQLVGHPGERPARRRPPRSPSSERFTWSGARGQVSSSAQVARSLRVPAAANRRMSRSAIVARTIGRAQVARSLEQRQHGVAVGRRPWPRSPTRAGAAGGCRRRPRRGRAGRGRSARRRPRAAAWPSRRAGCGPRRPARPRPRRRAFAAARARPGRRRRAAGPSRAGRRGRRCSSDRGAVASSKPPKRFRRPERLQRGLARLLAANSPCSSGAIDASLRSPISRRAVWRIPAVRVATALDQLGGGLLAEVDGSLRPAPRRLQPVDRGPFAGRSAPRGCGSG